MNRKYLSLTCLLSLLVGCSKEKFEEFVEPVPEPDPIAIINYSDSEDNSSDDNNNNGNGESADIEQNLLINGGLEEWSLYLYDMPNSWLCHNNYNVKREHKIVCEGRYSAKMKSLEKGSTATVDQRVQITPNYKIRIRFHYYVEQWKDKGARTYCYLEHGQPRFQLFLPKSLKIFMTSRHIVSFVVVGMD